MKRIRHARHADNHERLVCLVADFGGLLDLLITVFSGTLLSSNFRADVLFSDWALGEEL